MSEKYISLENLKEYNTKVKETYIKPLEDKVASVETATEKATAAEIQYMFVGEEL